MKYIETEFVKFAQAAIPSEASAEQRDDMRKAFFCGVIVVLKTIMSVDGESQEDQEQAVKVFDSIFQEAQEFAATTIVEIMVLESIKKGANEGRPPKEKVN